MDGNKKKMREALLIVKRLFDGGIMFQPAIRKAHKAVNEALSEPPRQCDVGTALEQKERFDAFCDAQPRKRNGCDCALQKNRQGLCEGLCEFAWAQTPYEAEEGGTDGVQSAS